MRDGVLAFVGCVAFSACEQASLPAVSPAPPVASELAVGTDDELAPSGRNVAVDDASQRCLALRQDLERSIAELSDASASSIPRTCLRVSKVGSAARSVVGGRVRLVGYLRTSGLLDFGEARVGLATPNENALGSASQALGLADASRCAPMLAEIDGVLREDDAASCGDDSHVADGSAACNRPRHFSVDAWSVHRLLRRWDESTCGLQGGEEGLLDLQAVRNSLQRLPLQRCLSPGDPSGAGHVMLRLDPSGDVSATVDPPYGGTRTGACIGAAIRSLRVPPFVGDPVVTGRSFTLFGANGVER
jgi:hypothetical protein